MENPEIRQNLEKEILRLTASNKKLTQDEFTAYYDCLLKLCRLDHICTIRQDEIFTAAYGNITDFVTEYVRHISSLTNRIGKKTHLSSVHDSKTDMLFSPRLIEIALGSALSIFLKNNVHTSLSVFYQKNNAVICVTGNSVPKNNLALSCIKKVAALHQGRCVLGFYHNFNEIVITLPRFPQFQPLKLVPCAPELCRLCDI